MRLNYQNSNNFGNNFANLWFQLLYRYLSSLKVKIYFKGFSLTKTLLNVFKTGYKRVSLFFKSKVAYSIGEVFFFFRKKKDDRGFVVPILLVGKGSTYFVRLVTKFYLTRLYTTRSEMKSLASVEEQQVTPKGLQVLAKH